MNKVKVIARVLLLGLIALYGVRAIAGASAASESWQKEFEEVCSKTQDAMSFSPAELKTLIQRCDALEPQIEKLDETRKKVYLRQLRQCRGLFAYVLESKTKDSK